MSNYFKFFSLSLFLVFTLSSCGDDDEVNVMDSANANESTAATLVGDWRTTSATIDGVDMSNSVFGTFSFEEDNTYTSTATEGGLALQLSGSYSVTEEGTLLSLFDNMAIVSGFPAIAGNAEHVISDVSDNSVTLTFVSTSTDRVLVLERI